jgi:hypothetical protein
VKKIPSLFARDAANPRVLSDAYHAAADWVVRGEGVATRKWDGTSVLIRDSVVYARYDAKAGKAPPPGFFPAQDPDPITGHHPGWVPASRPEDRWIRATYEACGPKINVNPERLEAHRLIRHGAEILTEVPCDKAGLIEFFAARDIEGVVWWRVASDDACDKVKITGEALGVRRPR